MANLSTERRRDIVNALNRQAAYLEALANKLAANLDYAAEFPDCDADCLREAARILASPVPEPIGEIRADTLNVFYGGILPPIGTKLYASPQPPAASAVQGELSLSEALYALGFKRDEDALLTEALDLTKYAAAPFFGSKERHSYDGEPYYIYRTTEEWWDGLRELIEALQPKLSAAKEDRKRPGIPQGWTLTQGKGAFSKDRWVCVQNDESQCGQEFWEIDNPLIYAFLAALAAQEGKTE